MVVVLVVVVIVGRGKSNDLRRTVNHPAAAAVVVQPVAVVTRYTGTTVISFITIPRNIIRSMFAGALRAPLPPPPPPLAAELGRRGITAYILMLAAGWLRHPPPQTFLARDGFFFLPRSGVPLPSAALQ